MKKTSVPRLIIYRVIIILLFAFSNTTFGQKADSMLTVLRSHHVSDTTRVGLFAGIADYYLDVNIDSAITFANDGLSISERINFDKGKTKCMQVLGSAYLQKSRYDKALKYFNDALQIHVGADNKEGEASCFKFLGNAYYLQSKYDTAFIYYNKSIIVSEQINYNKNIGLVLSNIGIIYNDLGDYPKALEYYQKALQILEKEKYTYGVAICLSDLASLYLTLGDHKKAIDYNNQCLSIYEKTGDKVDILATIVNEGNIYDKMNDHSNALITFKKGYALAIAIGETYWEKICKTNIAQENYFLENYDTAFAQYKEVLTESENAGEPNEIAVAHSGIGLVLIKKGNVAEGIEHLRITLDITQGNGLKELASQTAKDLSETYEMIHDYAHALEYNRIYYLYRDSLSNQKNDKLIHQLQFDDEIGRKNSQIQLLEKDEVSKQKIVIAAVVVLIMSIMIAILLFMNYKKSRKNLHTLTLFKEQLEKKNLEQDRILDTVAHDLRSPISGVVSLTGLLLNKDDMPDDIGKSISMIKNTSQSSLMLINELMGYRNETKDVINKEDTDVTKLVEEMVSLLQLNANEKKQQLAMQPLSSQVTVSVDKEKMKRVLANLIGNAIKFTPSGGVIEIKLEKRHNSVLISVTDTGIGIPANQQGAVFELFTESKRKGTAGEKSYGLGLAIARQIVIAHGGKIWFNSEEGKGSAFYVELFS